MLKWFQKSPNKYKVAKLATVDGCKQEIYHETACNSLIINFDNNVSSQFNIQAEKKIIYSAV